MDHSSRSAESTTADDRRKATERLYQHGGEIDSASLAFPDAPAPWIDLSTGINPIAYPIPPLTPDAWARLPERADLERLEAVAAARFGAQPRQIVTAPGTQALIQWIPRLFPARRIAVPELTYAEHERCWRTCGAAVSPFEPSDSLDGYDAVVLVNPNNPDGRLIPATEVRALGFKLRGQDGLLVVDEAFMDFKAESVAIDVPPSTVVLRSFGKTYGLAGVRLGFAVAAADIAGRLKAALGPWSVSGPAVAIATLALADDAWLARTAARLQDDGAWLDQVLERAGFEAAGGCELFRLVRHAEARQAFGRLCEFGVLTRPFSKRPELLRFGIPTQAQRSRVADGLNASRAR